MSTSMVNAVTLVREAKGWNQSELAREANLSQPVVSRIENGALDVAAERLEALAQALECPPALLASTSAFPIPPVSCLHHRRRKSTMSVRTVRRIEALTQLVRLSVQGLMSGLDPTPKRTLNREPVALDGDARMSAVRLREEWNLGSGPLGSVAGLVESAGVVVVSRDLRTPGQDAVSTWPTEFTTFPMILVADGLAPDRFRFTLAHELGHLVMHTVAGPEQEDQANAFAGEFLMPRDAVRRELAGLKTSQLARLIALKERWGMSIAALVRRAYDLEIVTERQHREFHMRLGQLGWRRSEPGSVGPETITTVERLIAAQQESRRLTIPQIAELAGMTESAFRRHYLPDPPSPTDLVPITLGEG